MNPYMHALSSKHACKSLIKMVKGSGIVKVSEQSTAKGANRLSYVKNPPTALFLTAFSYFVQDTKYVRFCLINFNKGYIPKSVCPEASEKFTKQFFQTICSEHTSQLQ